MDRDPITNPGHRRSNDGGDRESHAPAPRASRRDPRSLSGGGSLNGPPQKRAYSPPPDPRIGRVINDRYRILAPLGSGGMASVYLAEQLGIGGEVAIKFLRTDVARDKRFLRRFEVEARALARIDHPHCVSVRDFGVADVPYIVMPRVDGPTLYDELKKGPMSPARTVAITRQLLAALGHAHQRGIIHRDVKPENVKVQQDTREHVRLLDFGLAKLRRPPAGMPPTNPLIAVGTPSYMSPEQFIRGAVDARSDIYSTGALMFELLTGRKPFEFERIADACRMHTTWPRPRLRQAAPDRDFSPELEAVILKAMAQAPEDRFQTTQEFRAALDAVPEAAGAARQTGARPAIGAEDASRARRPTGAVRSRGKRKRGASKETLQLPAIANGSRAPAPRTATGGRGWLVALLVVAGLGIAVLEVPALRNAVDRLTTSRASAEDAAPAAEPVARPVSSALEDPAAPLLERANDAANRGDWAQAMVLYGQAVRLDASVLDSDTLYAHAIEALGTRNGRRAAVRLIERDLGDRAIAPLQQAAEGHADRRIRRRAQRLLDKLQAHRPASN